MMGHLVVGVAGDIAVDQAKKLTAKQIEKSKQAQKMVQGLRTSIQKFDGWIRRRGISPSKASSRALTPPASSSPDVMAQIDPVGSSERATTPGPTCRIERDESAVATGG